MATTSQPNVAPFTYLHIPYEDTKAVEELRFTGNSEAELRRTLTRCFRRSLLSEDQKTDMARHLVSKANESAKKHAVNGDAEAGSGAAPPSEEVETRQAAMIDEYLDQASYEIIPVTMPMRATKFIGTSLYIDDSGAFKDLPLNHRASKLAQREIRGDAFLLSNHDDPALDEWGRVDCPLQRYEELFTNPPKAVVDTSNQAQMMRATMLRDAETKKISVEDYEKAQQAKEDGNRLFADGDLRAAVQAYSMTVDMTDGRRDLLPDEEAATQLRLSALLNRCLCYTRLSSFPEAVKDAQAAAQLAPTSLKAHYRLTYALCGAQEYEAAEQSCAAYTQLGGGDADVAAMRSTIAAGKAEVARTRKDMYSKMFRA
ncbi:TPR repeat [Novymonas esmeraldas]|uniref:TPR repeat n=1 Tax=Novymonas esmeraldas TaxID=1808958 RepID=A0AAW0EWN7_9TRYP